MRSKREKRPIIGPHRTSKWDQRGGKGAKKTPPLLDHAPEKAFIAPIRAPVLHARGHVLPLGWEGRSVPAGQAEGVLVNGDRLPVLRQLSTRVPNPLAVTRTGRRPDTGGRRPDQNPLDPLPTMPFHDSYA